MPAARQLESKPVSVAMLLQVIVLPSHMALEERAQTFLRTLGIEIVFGREGRSGTRTIRITAMGENRTHDTVSTVSRVSDHGDRAGLNHPPPGLEQAL